MKAKVMDVRWRLFFCIGVVLASPPLRRANVENDVAVNAQVGAPAVSVSL